MAKQSEMSVVVVDEEESGDKAPFGRAREKLLRVTSVSAETLGQNVAALCEYVGQVFVTSQEAVGDLSLDAVEVTVEVTAKGEVRLVGAAAAELKGGLKLCFKRAASSP